MLVWSIRPVASLTVGLAGLLVALWGDYEGEHARLAAAAGDGALAKHFFTTNFEALYG